MKFKDILAWWFGNTYVVSRVEVDFDFITQSGSKIFTIEDNQNVDGSILYDGSWSAGWDVRQNVIDSNKDSFNKQALEKLKEYRKKKKVVLNGGVVIPGDYIVKCVWDVRVKFKKASYDKFLEIRNG